MKYSKLIKYILMIILLLLISYYLLDITTSQREYINKRHHQTHRYTFYKTNFVFLLLKI